LRNHEPLGTEAVAARLGNGSVLPTIASDHVQFEVGQIDIGRFTMNRKQERTPVQAIEAALTEKLTWKDGSPVKLRLLPAITKHQLAQFEQSLGNAVSADIRDLLFLAAGFEFPPVGTRAGICDAPRDIKWRGILSNEPYGDERAGGHWHGIPS